VDDEDEDEAPTKAKGKGKGKGKGDKKKGGKSKKKEEKDDDEDDEASPVPRQLEVALKEASEVLAAARAEEGAAGVAMPAGADHAEADEGEKPKKKKKKKKKDEAPVEPVVKGSPSDHPCMVELLSALREEDARFGASLERIGRVGLLLCENATEVVTRTLAGLREALVERSATHGRAVEALLVFVRSAVEEPSNLPYPLSLEDGELVINQDEWLVTPPPPPAPAPHEPPVDDTGLRFTAVQAAAVAKGLASVACGCNEMPVGRWGDAWRRLAAAGMLPVKWNVALQSSEPALEVRRVV
jgi:hypothetical protein